MYIGRGGETFSFDGIIDEVRIYNRALNEEEIKGEGPSSFTLGLSENEVALVDGQASLTVTLSPAEGSSGIVYLGIEGLPSGMEWNFSQNPVFLTGDTPATVMLSLNGTPPQVESTVTVVARGYGEQPREERASFILDMTVEVTPESLGYVDAWDSPGAGSTGAQGIRWRLNEGQTSFTANWKKEIYTIAATMGYSKIVREEIINQFDTAMNKLVSSIPDFVEEFVTEYVEQTGSLPSAKVLADALRAYLWSEIIIVYANSYVEASNIEGWFEALAEIGDMIKNVAIGELIGWASGSVLNAALVAEGYATIAGADAIGLLSDEIGALVGFGGEQVASSVIGRASDVGDHFLFKMLSNAIFKTMKNSAHEWVYTRGSDEGGLSGYILSYAYACLSGGNYSTAPPWDVPDYEFPEYEDPE